MTGDLARVQKSLKRIIEAAAIHASPGTGALANFVATEAALAGEDLARVEASLAAADKLAEAAEHVAIYESDVRLAGLQNAELRRRAVEFREALLAYVKTSEEPRS